MKILIAKSESWDNYYYKVDEELSKKDWDEFVKENIGWEYEDDFNCLSDVTYIDLNELSIIK